MALLSFGKMKHNAKLAATGGKGYTFSLPAGHSCPAATECKASADRESGKITDGAAMKFRCFAASMDAIYTNVRNRNWRNFDALRAAKDASAMANLIDSSLPADATIVRVHVAGDFYNKAYFQAWMAVASRRPNVRFYAYTKMIRAMISGEIPPNFVLTASYGGTHDHLIQAYGLRSAIVVQSEADADRLGLEIDHDDSHAMNPGPSFALLIHGVQPKGGAFKTVKGKAAKAA